MIDQPMPFPFRIPLILMKALGHPEDVAREGILESQ